MEYSSVPRYNERADNALVVIEQIRQLAVEAERRGKNLQSVPELKLVGNAYVGMSERIFKILEEAGEKWKSTQASSGQ